MARMLASARPWTGVLLALPLLLFLLAAVVWPLGRLAVAPLTGSGRTALAAVLAAGRYRTALVSSLTLSAGAAVAAVVLSLVPAWVLARERFAGRAAVRTLLALPLTFSGLVVGFLMLVLVGQSGAVPRVIGFLAGRERLGGAASTLAGLFLAYLYFEVPRAVMTLEAAFRSFPDDLDAAARVLGAGPLERLLRIRLPLSAPALRSALAITFSAAMGSFGVALVLARRFPVAPLELYAELAGPRDDEVAGALCLVLAAITLAVERLLVPRAGGAR